MSDVIRTRTVIRIVLKNIVMHNNIDIDSLATVSGSMELSGLLGEVHEGL